LTICYVDFETKCILDLKTCGLDRYSKKAEVLMLGWAFDEDDVQIWEPRFGPLPKEIMAAIKSDCTLVAWNSGFERSIFKHVLGIDIPIDRWLDPSVYARTLSLPGSLQSTSDILGLGDQGKDEDGKRLIKLFCEPASMGGELTLFGITEPYFREPEKHLEDWEKFKEYCRQDVRAERKILKDLEQFVPPEIERRVWCLDQRINETGVPVNREFVKKALTLAERSKEELQTALKEKTQLENPNSRDQMLEWCRSQRYPFQSLEKASVNYALSGKNITDLCREVLLLRKEAAKTSYMKLSAILNRLGDDNYLRDQFKYLGAARTGRWSGGGGGREKGGVQFQNMPRPTKEVEKNLEKTIAQIEALDYEDIKAAHPSVITAVTSCIRSAFQSPVGKKFIVCDLSAIENRVLGWLAGEDKILQVFMDNLDPYIAFAVLMYNKTYDELLNDKEKRQISKSAVLGCFGDGTLVLTQRGWVPILDVQIKDQLWDGKEWVSHQGIVCQGRRIVVQLNGVLATPEHEILTEEGNWNTAWELLQNTQLEKKAIDLANGKLFAATEQNGTSSMSVPARNVEQKNPLTETIWNSEKQGLALFVQTKKFLNRKAASIWSSESAVGTILIDWRIGIMPFFPAAVELRTQHTDTQDAALNAISLLSMISSGTRLLWQDGIIPRCRLIGKTMMGIMREVTFGLFPQKLTTAIKKIFDGLNGTECSIRQPGFGKSTALAIAMQEQCAGKFEKDSPQKESLQTKPNVKVPTYDILNAGPRNRFTILTDKGPMIVHNCGYGLGSGVARVCKNCKTHWWAKDAMCPKKKCGSREFEYEAILKDNGYGDLMRTGLLAYAENMGVIMTPRQAYIAQQTFRKAYTKVVELWAALEAAAKQSISEGIDVTVGTVVFSRLEFGGQYILRITLPSGRSLHYMNVQLVTRSLVGADGREYEKQTIMYDGIGHGVGEVSEAEGGKGSKWGPTYSYGGKLAENITQAIARDILAYGMLLADEAGANICAHAHDEVICLADDNALDFGLDDLRYYMSQSPSWAKDLPLAAEGYCDRLYRKN
jgi:hypothetical protein